MAQWPAPTTLEEAIADRTIHGSAVSDPVQWYGYGRALKDSADLLRPRIDTRPWWFSPFGEAAEPPSPDAKVLVHVAGFLDVYLLLVALSVEVLLKAIIVRDERRSVAARNQAMAPGVEKLDLSRDPDLMRRIVDAGRGPGQSGTHQLAAYADRSEAGQLLTADERGLLATLSDAIISFGRYPGGVRPDRGAIAPPINLDVEATFKCVDGLFDKLRLLALADVAGDPTPGP